MPIGAADPAAPLVVTRGPDHLVELLTPAACELFGARSLIGRPFREVVSGPDASALLELLDRTYREDAPVASGRGVPQARRFGAVCSALRAPDGVVTGLVLHTIGATEATGPELRAAEASHARSASLLQLAEALSSVATPSAIGELAVTRAADLLAADAATAFVTHPAGLEQVHSRGWPAELTAPYLLLELRRGRPLSDAVLDANPVWLEDSDQWRARYPEMAPVHLAGGYEASACLPLRVDDRNVGALVFSFLRPRAFTGEERDYLLAVAALCAQALDRARLYVAEQEARAAAEWQRDRSAFLAEASLVLDAPMSVEDRLRRLADLVVPEVADWCTVTLVGDHQVEQIAVTHRDPAKVAFAREVQERYPPDPDAPGSSLHVARTGTPSFIAEIADELLVAAARDATHLELLRAIGLHSAMTVPLLVRGRSLGSLALVSAESRHVFDRADLAFAEQLAGRAALALDNARLYECQRGIAQTLQAALLPDALPDVPGMALAARYLAQAEGTEVGGDVYDVFAGTEPGSWVLMVADVCGKGPEAAALTALIRYTLRAEAGHGLPPAEVLRRLNAAMLHHGEPGEARFATVVHGRVLVDACGVSLKLVSAGHLPPLMLRGDRVEAVVVPGTLLGVFPDPELTEVELRIGPGESVLLYTDGVTEARARSGSLYGAERLADTLAACAGRAAEEIVDGVVAEVLAFSDGSPRDDVAALVLQAAS